MRTVIAVLFGALVACSLGGCQNPNYIGVQDYGYIVGNVVDQNGKAIPNALVTSTGTNVPVRTGANGGFNIQNVAAGEQTVNVQAAGYQPAAPVTVIVTANQGVQAGNIVMQTATPST